MCDVRVDIELSNGDRETLICTDREPADSPEHAESHRAVVYW